MSTEWNAGDRVKLAPNRQGWWGAHLWGPFYLDLNHQPTGTVVGLQRGREQAGDQVIIRIDGQPADWPYRAWSIQAALVQPAGSQETRPAAIVGSDGRPIDAQVILETLQEVTRRTQQ